MITRHLFLLCFALALANVGRGATVARIESSLYTIELTPAYSYTTTFPVPLGEVSLGFGLDFLQLGDRMIMRVFEDSALDAPIYSRTFDGTQVTNAFAWTFNTEDYFRDDQAVIQLEWLAGSVEVDSIIVRNQRGSERFEYSASPNLLIIPEPSSSTLFLSLVGLVALRRKRQKLQNKACERDASQRLC
jgi:hypothetical protein